MSVSNVVLIVGACVGAFGSLAGFYQWWANREAETGKQREDREAQERKDDLSRYDAGVWAIVKNLQGELATVRTELQGLRDENRRIINENMDLRGEKLQMKNTIDQLTKRVAYLERHEAADGAPGRDGRDGRDGLLLRDDRQDGED